MKVVIAPDSFKGSLDAIAVAEAMAQGVRAAIPDAEIRLCPMADGGEGTLDAVRAVRKCETRETVVTDAKGEQRRVPWLVLMDEPVPTALIEVAQVVGLPDARIAVAERTTLGVGQLLRHVLDQGMRRIMVGLGGTSTNEGGIGALSALGGRFHDGAGIVVTPNLAGLEAICAVDLRDLDARLRTTDLVLLTDVGNPLCGASGATMVFGPQKGLPADQLARCDALMRRYASLCDDAIGTPLSMRAGSGAAGGLGYALLLAGGRVTRGAESVAALVRLRESMIGADRVMTGEGRSDRQTLMGKTAMAVSDCARAAGLPVILLSGSLESGSMEALSRHFDACVAASDGAANLQQAMAHAAELVRQAAERVARSW